MVPMTVVMMVAVIFSTFTTLFQLILIIVFLCGCFFVDVSLWMFFVDVFCGGWIVDSG